MKKVNDRKIYKNKYYPLFYRGLELNLAPISYYSREEAEFTLSHQFGKSEVKKNIRIIKGNLAIKRGLELGKNSYIYLGKHYQIKKHYIPPEYNYNRSKRRYFTKKLKKGNQPSQIKHSYIQYRLKTYG